mmetsp:Transcript_80858/g.127780  ORF Transcript_80858/g.127780 Transcript_80858/m.127780 type:complete len:227 (+) Transcript_80858:634-1314(+)
MRPCMLHPTCSQRSCRPNCSSHPPVAETQALHGSGWARPQGKRSQCRPRPRRTTPPHPGVPMCRHWAWESSGEAVAMPTWASCDRDSGPSWGLKVDRRKCTPSNAPGRSKTASPRHLLVHILRLLEYSSMERNTRQTRRRSPGLQGEAEDLLLRWVHLPRRRFESRTSGDGWNPWALGGAPYWIHRAVGQPRASSCRRTASPIESDPPFSPLQPTYRDAFLVAMGF